jgi:hypothetical protein
VPTEADFDQVRVEHDDSRVPVRTRAVHRIGRKLEIRQQKLIQRRN